MRAKEKVVTVAVHDWAGLKAAVEAGGRRHVRVSGTLESTATVVVPVGAEVTLEAQQVHVTRTGLPRREFDVGLSATLVLRGSWTVSARDASVSRAPFVKGALGSVVRVEGQVRAEAGSQAAGSDSLFASEGELRLEEGAEVSGWVVSRTDGPRASGAAVRLEGPRARLVMNGGRVCHNANLGIGEAPSPAVQLWNGAEFRMNGGSICENNLEGTAAVNGGGVYLNGATFVMNGGCIKDNRAYCGGGVYAVEGRTEQRLPGRKDVPSGTLVVNGGTIADNAAQFIGGGIYSETRVSLTGAEVTGNAALYGGGVYSGSGQMELQGGSIARNLAMSTQYAGGGVYIGRYGSLRATGGSICENSCEGIGGGIYSKGETCLDGTQVTDNTAQAGGGLCNDQGALKLTGGEVRHNRAIKAGGILNSGDATIAGPYVGENSATGGADDLCNQEDGSLRLEEGAGLAWFADDEGGRFRDGSSVAAEPLDLGDGASLPSQLHAEPLAHAA